MRRAWARAGGRPPSGPPDGAAAPGRFRLVPFLVELRAVMDWVWTDTTLSLSNWMCVEDIYANVFIIKCSRATEKVPARRGVPGSLLGSTARGKARGHKALLRTVDVARSGLPLAEGPTPGPWVTGRGWGARQNGNGVLLFSAALLLQLPLQAHPLGAVHTATDAVHSRACSLTQEKPRYCAPSVATPAPK